MITITESAQEKFTQILENQNQVGWPIRLNVIGKGISSFAYDLASTRPEMRREDDTVIEVGELTFLINEESAPHLAGAEVTWNAEKGGFQVNNPNPVWTDEIGATVARVIIEQINPGIASHGGAVLPVDVKNNVVYVRMLGGCQGCGMANQTLTLGVEKAIKEAVPGITAVMDVTYHAAGQNPYYAPKPQKDSSPGK